MNRDLSAITAKLPSFWRNASTVLGGTIVAQLIPIAILPILTRILPADQLGGYFVWYGAVTVLMVIAGARLDMAVYTAHTEDQIRGLLRATLVISTGVGLAAVLVAIIYQTVFGQPLIEGFGGQYKLAWGLCAIVLANNQITLAVYVYRSQFKHMALAKITMTGVVAIAQLVLSFAGAGLDGLIYGQLVSAALVAWLWMRKTGAAPLGLLRHASIAGFWRTLQENYRFPLYAMPSDFVGTFAGQIPLFIIAAKFGTVAVASYALVLRILSAPVSLLANSILAAFKDEAGRDFRQLGNCSQAFRSAFKSLLFLAIIPFTVLFLFGEPLIKWVFGNNWATAGRYAEILAPMFFMRFIASPLSYTLYIANKQLQDLVWQFALLAMTWMVFSLTGSLESAVKAYSLGYSLLYVIYLGMSYWAALGGVHGRHH